MRCPVCKAENTTGPQCRRCRADLSLLFALEEQRERALAEARRHIGRGEGGPAVAAAQAAEALRSGEDARRLLVLGCLLQPDFARAWELYSRIAQENHHAAER
jgi:hypothetical protein